eukprot:901555-Pelagomonas_calceolata.AAC.1
MESCPSGSMGSKQAGPSEQLPRHCLNPPELPGLWLHDGSRIWGSDRALQSLDYQFGEGVARSALCAPVLAGCTVCWASTALQAEVASHSPQL